MSAWFLDRELSTYVFVKLLIGSESCALSLCVYVVGFHKFGYKCVYMYVCVCVCVCVCVFVCG